LTYCPNGIYQALLKRGEDYADKKAAYLLLDSMTKPCLSEAFRRTRGASATEKKELVFCDESYLKHLRLVGDARRAYLLAEVRCTSIQSLADARLTKASTRRTEAKNGSVQPY